MSLKALPLDPLSQVIQYLPLNYVLRFKLAGDRAFWGRILQEKVVKDAFIQGEIPFAKALPCFGNIIHTLRLRMRLPLSHKNQARYWIEHLPPSLEVIDFNFPGCAKIWLRKVQPGETHFKFTSQHGFGPVYLCEVLPNLKVLRLKDKFDSHMNENQSLGWNERDWKKYRLHDPDPYKYGNTSREGQLLFTAGMIMMFIRKLPRGLVSLEMPIIPPIAIESLSPLDFPPLLTRLSMLCLKEEIFFSKPIPELASPGEMNESLYESLIHLKWKFRLCEFAQIMPRFRCLQSLSIIRTDIKGSQYHLLPRTLTSLKIRTLLAYSGAAHVPTPLAEPGHFALLPPSLVSLVIYNPIRDLDISFIPQSITSLKILQAVGCEWVLESIFEKMRVCFPQLTKLKVTSTDSTTASLSWVPVETLRDLELWIPSASDDLFTTWPKDYGPNNITRLFIRTMQAPKFTDKLATLLPPKLQDLNIVEPMSKSSFTPKGFLGQCPRSLTSLELIRPLSVNQGHVANPLAISACWKDDDILPLSESFCKSKNLAPPTICLPPSLTKISAQILHGGRLIGNELTEASKDGYCMWRIKTANGLLRWCDLADQATLRLLPPTFSANITKIDLPIGLGYMSPVWRLKNLETLIVPELLVGDRDIAKLPVNPNLTTLKIKSSLSPAWLSKGHLHSLTSLKCLMNLGKLDKTSSFAALTRLTVLSIELQGKPDESKNRIDYETVQLQQANPLYASIPNSVTKLSANILPFGFFENGEERQLIELSLTQEERILDTQLRLLPHLKILKCVGIVVTDILALYSGLPRDMRQYSDVHTERRHVSILQSLTPSLETLEPRSSLFFWEFHGIPHRDPVAVYNYLMDSQRSEAELEKFDPGELASVDTTVNQILLNFGPSTSDTNELAKSALRRCARLISALPSTLTSLTFHHFYLPLMHLLPQSLVTLDVRDSPQFCSHPTLGARANWPPTLTSLGFRVLDSVTLGPKFFESMPRALSTLVIQDLTHLQEAELRAFPPILKKLKLPQIRFKKEFRHLPLSPSLTTLSIGYLAEPKLIETLPLSITQLSLAIPASGEGADSLYVLNRFKQSHFNINLTPKTKLTSVQYSMHFNIGFTPKTKLTSVQQSMLDEQRISDYAAEMVATWPNVRTSSSATTSTVDDVLIDEKSNSYLIRWD